jgi:hypothetical protein
MKRLIFPLFIFIIQAKVIAQSPQGIPYQAIARNASGVAIANTAVKVRFSIRDSITTGAIKYQETHNPTTSALGLFSVNVGMGTVVSGTFSGINWGKNAKFMQVEMDPAGGSTYTDLGTTQMMSVPYALFSENTENCGFTHLQVFDTPGTFSWTAPITVRKVKVECWGGGAGGVMGMGIPTLNGASGGYGMGIFPVNPNQTYPVTVGKAGSNFVNQDPSPTLGPLSEAFGGASSFGGFISASGGTYFIPNGSSIGSLLSAAGISNGMVSIKGSLGTSSFGGGTTATAGDAPLGGGGGNAAELSGQAPGGGGMAATINGISYGGHGRVIIWW